MEALEAIEKRRSVRRYQSRAIDREILEKIVDAGRRAPSANNIQPWEFVVVTDKKSKEEIGRLADYGHFIADAAACIAVFCRDAKFYLEDGCAATENMLIAATALGIGSCWVAGDKKPYTERTQVLLGVPSGYQLVSLIPLGYSSEEGSARQKRKPAEVLHWDRF